MSDMNHRGARDFSGYDSLETAELEEILRMDTEAPEGEESDYELILYVMGVLADRRRNNGSFTGKTAEEAYESFIQNYLPELEEHAQGQQENRRSKRTPKHWLRSVTAAAAVLVVVLFGSITAKSFGLDVWKIVVTWAQETFCFGTAEDMPVGNNELPYDSLQDALNKNFSNPVKVPTQIPEGYELVEIRINESPAQKKYMGIYDNGEARLKITVQSYIDTHPERVEQGEGFVEIYTADGIDYYLFSNYEIMQAVWISESFECLISGELTMEELKWMIDSIGKG